MSWTSSWPSEFPLEDVILRSTWNPAREIKHEELGHLSVGALADVAVLRVEKGNYGFADMYGARQKGTQKLTCELTLNDGKVVYDLNGLTRPDWESLPKDYRADRRPALGPNQRRRTRAKGKTATTLNTICGTISKELLPYENQSLPVFISFSSLASIGAQADWKNTTSGDADWPRWRGPFETGMARAMLPRPGATPKTSSGRFLFLAEAILLRAMGRSDLRHHGRSDRR